MGTPRLSDRRTAFNCAGGCAAFSCASQFMGSGHGQRAVAGAWVAFRELLLDHGHSRALETRPALTGLAST